MHPILSAAGTSAQTYHPGPAFDDLIEGKNMSAYKVLVVDDETEIVEEVVELLEGEDIVAVGANDADKALELVRADSTIGVVLSDIRMPGMDGLEMSRLMHSDEFEGRDLSVIIMTGHAGMGEAIEALQIGAEDFLTKPINADQLLHAVCRGLETVRLRQRDRNYARDLAEEVKRRTAQALSLSRELELKNAELSQKNDELAASARLKDEFLGMISHELNTPLNAMIGFAQILDIKLQDSGLEKERSDAQCIIDAGGRLMKNVKSILTLADIQAGRITANKQATLVGDLLEGAVSLSTQDEKNAGSNIKTALSDPELLAFIDPVLMKTALAGVLENAIRFAGADADIKLQAKDAGETVEVTVLDNGPGIAPDVLGIALEPFRQVDGSLRRRFEGMGLGLPLARKVAELHGGQLSVDSAPDKGTVVSFVLPKKSA